MFGGNVQRTKTDVRDRDSTLYIPIKQGFPYWGESPPVAENLLIPHPYQKNSHCQIFVTHRDSFPQYLIKIFIESLVTAAVSFFSTLCSIYTCHANFYFNWSSIFTVCSFLHQKGSNGQNRSLQNPHHLIKKISPIKISHPPHWVGFPKLPENLQNLL